MVHGSSVHHSILVLTETLFFYDVEHYRQSLRSTPIRFDAELISSDVTGGIVSFINDHKCTHIAVFHHLYCGSVHYILLSLVIALIVVIVYRYCIDSSCYKLSCFISY